jgi:methylthioribose-1-phosphate isomerase
VTELARAPLGAQAYNPAFDVTPAELITAIVTENGTVYPVTAVGLAAVGAGRKSSTG